MNIGSLLTNAAHRFGGNLAIAQGDRTWTYCEFNDRVNRLANALRARGVMPGDNVALLMYNRPEMLEAMFAAFKAGCGAVPINFRLHPDEFTFIIDHSQAKAVFVSPEFNDALDGIRDRVPRVRHAFAVTGAHGETLDYETVLAGASAQFRETELEPDHVAWLFYTSGTTGQPKGAMLTHKNLLAMSASYEADMRPGDESSDVILHSAPLSHGSGLYALPNVANAAAHVFPESTSFDPEAVLGMIERYRVTNMFASPTMVKRLMDSPRFDKFDLSSLASLIYGGAPILVEDLFGACRKFGPSLVQLYGQGESPMTIAYLPHEDHVLNGSDEQLRRFVSVGVVRTNVEVAVFDEEDREVPRGEMGEIVTRSDVVMKGYWMDPDASAATLRNGWLHTGDLGYMDEKGYVFLMARSKDLIISGGENIYAREVEDVLVRHPAVQEVAVIGVPDLEWGESVKAVVVTEGDSAVTEADLIAFCKDHIASYKKPKSVDFIDELPKNNYGKIVKKELRARFGASE
jgi:acyl-CoA synthetase (AMP-forming)/AMP-acid ligase II